MMKCSQFCGREVQQSRRSHKPKNLVQPQGSASIQFITYGLAFLLSLWSFPVCVVFLAVVVLPLELRNKT
jgi:hypothetical protein